MPVHCWRSSCDLDVGVDLVELGDRVLDHLVRRVAAVEPQADRLALAVRRRRRPAAVGRRPAARRRRSPRRPRSRRRAVAAARRRRRRRRRRRACRRRPARPATARSCLSCSRCPPLDGCWWWVLSPSGGPDRAGPDSPPGPEIGSTSSDAELLVEDERGGADEDVVERRTCWPARSRSLGDHGHRAGGDRRRRVAGGTSRWPPARARTARRRRRRAR